MEWFFDYVTTAPAWHWLILALILLLAELLTGTQVLLWPAAAAVVTGVFAWGPWSLPWQIQWLVFGVLLFVFSFAGERFIRPKWLDSERPKLSSRTEQLVGARAKVITDFDAGTGRVEVKGSQWRAVLGQGTSPTIGDWVTVTAVEGATLHVTTETVLASAAPANPS